MLGYRVRTTGDIAALTLGRAIEEIESISITEQPQFPSHEALLRHGFWSSEKKVQLRFCAVPLGDHDLLWR